MSDHMTSHTVRPWLVRGLAAAALVLSACSSASQAPPTTVPAAAAKPTDAPKPAAPAATSAPAAAPTTAPAATSAPAAAVAKPTEPAKPAAAPAEDLNALYQAAKQEGEFNFYTTLNTNNGQPVIEKFMARYPGVKVNYNRQTSEKLEEVMTQEAKAGKMNWDVVECNEDVYVRFIANGFLQQYVSTSSAKYPDNLKDPNKMWVTDRVNPQTPSLNTNLVKPEEYPKVWDDLTKPSWKGRIAIEQGNVLLYTATKAEWGNDKALAFWKGIAANQPSIRNGNTDTAQLLAAGEFPLAVNIYTGEPNRLAGQGAPTKVIPLDPVFLQLQLLGLGAKAEHPNAAKLFINWFLDDEGQKALNENGILAAKPDVFQQGAAYLGTTRILPIKPEVAEKSGADIDAWRQVMGIQ
jgi:iron(III) transport system substrate-binding protein